MVWSARSVAQIEQRIADKGFLIVENCILLGTTFIDVNVDSISLRRQPVCPIKSAAVVITGTKDKEDPVVQVKDAEERPVSLKVAKATVIPPLSQIPVLVRAPSPSLQMDTHPYLRKSRMAMVARGMCGVCSNRPFKVLNSNCSWL